MADYYPVLARAVSRLADNTAPARRDVYEHARTIIVEQFASRDRQELTPRALSERSALEAAIRRVEAETRSSQTRPKSQPAAARASLRQTGMAGAEPPSKTTASSLAKILQALETGETRGSVPATTDLVPLNRTKAATPTAPPEPPAATGNRRSEVTAELEEVSNSLGAMFFGIAYIAAATAFIGVTYIRAAVWMYQGVIGYPTLLAVMAIALGLFVIPPIAIIRKASALPNAGSLSRRVLYGHASQKIAAVSPPKFQSPARLNS